MNHGPRWLFNMERCCDMQIPILADKLQLHRIVTREDCVVRPQYPAASNEEDLFSSMNLSANIRADGTVELEGIVFYWRDGVGSVPKTAVIRTFGSLDECIKWLSNDFVACRKCVEALDENC